MMDPNRSEYQQRSEFPMKTQYPNRSEYNASAFDDYFSDKNIRANFIRKVYCILMVQMLFTVLVISAVLFVDEIRFFVLGNLGLYLAAYVTFFITYFLIICCGNLRRQHPWNWVLLILLTISMAFLVGMISSYHNTQIVLFAMAITAAVCFFISVFATVTSLDITGCGGFLCIGLLVVLIFGLITMIVCIFSQCRIMMMIYSSLIAFIFSLYLMYDTQMIMGGRQVQLSPEEYVFGAVMLYMDIIQIFMAILTLTSMSQN